LRLLELVGNHQQQVGRTDIDAGLTKQRAHLSPMMCLVMAGHDVVERADDRPSIKQQFDLRQAARDGV
jgi:hypothetical protein